MKSLLKKLEYEEKRSFPLFIFKQFFTNYVFFIKNEIKYKQINLFTNVSLKNMILITTLLKKLHKNKRGANQLWFNYN